MTFLLKQLFRIFNISIENPSVSVDLALLADWVQTCWTNNKYQRIKKTRDHIRPPLFCVDSLIKRVENKRKQTWNLAKFLFHLQKVLRIRLKVDNRQLFGTDKHVNQLYLSSGRIYKMGEHSPNDASSVETGKFRLICVPLCTLKKKPKTLAYQINLSFSIFVKLICVRNCELKNVQIVQIWNIEMKTA